MNIKAETCGRAVIFNCRGELSADSLEAFSREVNRHLSSGDAKRDGPRAAGAGNVTDLIFNLAEVPFIDSAGLEYLLDLQEQLVEQLGKVTLTNLEENVAKILEITRLNGNFEICQDVSEAVKAL